MMMLKINKYIHITSLVLLLIFGSIDSGFSLVGAGEQWQTNEITALENGMYQRSGGDPYIVFPAFSDSVCVISGVRLKIRLSSMITKPFLAELFWKPENGGWSEDNKVFFILHPVEGNTLDFIVPIPRAVGYNQVRFDLPRDIDVAFSIEKYEVIDLRASTEETVKKMEVYSKLSGSEAKEMDILIPYLAYTLKHGGKRLLSDPPFFIFWMLLILLTLFTIRYVKRRI